MYLNRLTSLCTVYIIALNQVNNIFLRVDFFYNQRLWHCSDGGLCVMI